MAAECILLDMIHQRMMEMGYCREDYRISPFAAVIGQPTRYSAFNEFWYLYSSSVPDTVTIESDSSYFSQQDASDYKTLLLYGYKEFTGNIRVNYAGGGLTATFEFVRVTIIKNQQSC